MHIESDIERQNKRYYDTEAKAYDRNRYSSLTGQRVELFHKNVIAELLVTGTPQGSSVLEVGCGTGRLLQHLVPQGYDLHGLDVSQPMLAAARERLGGDACLAEGNAKAMPYPDANFDAVYAILVVNLIPDYEALFSEVARVLRPGGIFLFNVPNLASLYFGGGLYVNLRRKTVGANEAGYRYSHWFRPSEWRNGLSRAGFLVERVLGQPPHVGFVDDAAPLEMRGLGLMLSRSLYIRAKLGG